jgi:Na+-translocating ferredoxin:NAD+ oxidoreductase RnfG subunit
MKKLLMIMTMALIFMACGDPAAYKMNKQEFNETYETQIKELVQEQMKLSMADALKGDKSKDEMKEEAEANFSEKLKDLTGLTLEEFQELKLNWDMIKETQPEGYKEMTIKEILDYK